MTYKYNYEKFYFKMSPGFFSNIDDVHVYLNGEEIDTFDLSDSAIDFILDKDAPKLAKQWAFESDCKHWYYEYGHDIDI